MYFIVSAGSAGAVECDVLQLSSKNNKHRVRKCILIKLSLCGLAVQATHKN
jgi:hypothetical protein